MPFLFDVVIGCQNHGLHKFLAICVLTVPDQELHEIFLL